MHRLMSVLLAILGRPDTTDMDAHIATAMRVDDALTEARRVSRRAARIRRIVDSYIAGDSALDARRRRHW